MSNLIPRDRPAKDKLEGVEQGNNLGDACVSPSHERNGWLVQQPYVGFEEDYLRGNAVIAMCNRQLATSGVARENGFVVEACIDTNPVRHHSEILEFSDDRLGPNKPLVLAHDVELMKGPKQRCRRRSG